MSRSAGEAPDTRSARRRHNDYSMDRRFTFPSLPGKYDQALRDAVAFVLERFQPVGIVAAGTIVRGAPDPSSDLDLWVIHLQPVRQRLQKFFQGVPAEIFENPP